MANLKIEIADNGTKTLLTAGKYCDKNIEVEVNVAGGGGGDIPEEAFTFSGDISDMFSYDRWKWFWETYQNKIKFENVLNATNLFSNSKYEKLKVRINLAATGTQNGMSYIFSSMPNLKELDFKISGKITSNNMTSLFYSSPNLRYISNPFEELDMSYMATTTSAQQQGWFYGCYSLREIDKHTFDNIVISRSSSYGHLYSDMYANCYCLDDVYIPIYANKNCDSNIFDKTFDYITRAKSVLLQTNEDNTPLTVSWKGQTIDLTKNVGWITTTRETYITNYNSGITKDDLIKSTNYSSLAEYTAAMESNPNWYTTQYELSRYALNSAIATINSLPDTSAYLASAGGTNTIKFKGAQGSGREIDGVNQRISNLTAEQIAVATAKGWTVSLV